MDGGICKNKSITFNTNTNVCIKRQQQKFDYYTLVKLVVSRLCYCPCTRDGNSLYDYHQFEISKHIDY